MYAWNLAFFSVPGDFRQEESDDFYSFYFFNAISILF